MRYVCIMYYTESTNKRLSSRPLRIIQKAQTRVGRTLEAPIPKMSGLVKKLSPFSKRNNPL